MTRVMAGAAPLWVYAIQPRGLAVEGEVGITLSIPQLAGSYDYIPSESYLYVLLVGYNADIDVITSVSAVELTSLDYIGYVLLEPSLGESLEQVANGELSLQELKALLQ